MANDGGVGFTIRPQAVRARKKVSNPASSSHAVGLIAGEDRSVFPNEQ